MAAVNFPNNPSVNDTHTSSGSTWKWDGTVWQRLGEAGPQGAQGVQGAQGHQGVQGAQGHQGRQGATGAQGSVGIASLTIATSPPSSPDSGDMWWDSDDGDLHLYYNDGNSSQWANINNGPAGAQGAQGVQGAQGAQGHQGVQGAAGSSASVANAGNDRVVTSVSGTSLNAEANMQFDGTDLFIPNLIKHLGDPNNHIGFPGADIQAFTTSGTERVRIHSNGNVTIGSATFDTGNFGSVQGLNVYGTQPLVLVNATGNGTSFFMGKTSSACYFGTSDAQAINFRVSDADKMTFDASGRLLIGSTAKAGDSLLQVYTADRKHPAIRTNSPNANGYPILSDAYQTDESQVNIGISYSSASLVLSSGCKVSDSADNAYLSSQDTYSTRPCALKIATDGALSFHTTETNATTTTDSAVSLTEVFQIDRVGNIYQRITNRWMYFGASNQLQIGVNGSDPYINSASGDLKISDAGNPITVVRSDGFQMYQDIYFATAGKGIVLGNTSNVDANTLDSYEEGTFTPTILNGWGVLNSSPDVATGKYVRIGAIVYIYFSFKEGSGNGSFNGNRLSFYNFPYQAEGQWPNSTNYSHPLEAYTNSASSGGENIIGLPSSNGATVFSFVQKTSSGYTSFTGSNLGSSGQLFCAGVYRINGT